MPLFGLTNHHYEFFKLIKGPVWQSDSYNRNDLNGEGKYEE